MTRTMTLHAQWIDTLTQQQQSLPVMASFALWVAATLVKWKTHRRTRMHLRDLDDYLLEDIGLTRAQARHETNRMFWQS